MEFKLFKRQKSYVEITAKKWFYIIPCFKKPIYKNVKKDMGDKWDKELYFRSYFLIETHWLCFETQIKIAR